MVVGCEVVGCEAVGFDVLDNCGTYDDDNNDDDSSSNNAQQFNHFAVSVSSWPERIPQSTL